jgi:hypothetical protein
VAIDETFPRAGQWLSNLWVSIANDKGENGSVCGRSPTSPLPLFLDLLFSLDIGLR